MKKPKRHILVIDDEINFYLVIKNVLSEKNFQCYSAKTENEAREKWKQRHFDCIIFDLAMDEPYFNLTRQYFCKEVRKNNLSIPVIAVTGKPMSPIDGFRLAYFNIDAFFLKQEMNIIDFGDKIEQLINDYSTSQTKIRVPVSLPIKGINKPSVFICYSHDNKKWLNNFLEAIEPYFAAGIITYWVDTKIMAGENWGNAIKEAIDLSDVAVLLVSSSFLASKFILNFELPYIFRKKKKNKLEIIWFCIEPCAYQLVKELKDIQAAHNPDEPLDKLSNAKRKSILLSICKKINYIINRH